jgi:DNA topoisomerase I
MDLIIVESPTKAKTLTKFLKGNYRIEATLGHIRDLPKGELGVDVNNGFSPSYVTPREKLKRVKELKDLAHGADNVILATDPDREGEAIAWHVATILAVSKKKLSAASQKKSQKLKAKTKQLTPESFQRIAFHEITESAINEALKNPRTVDMQLVNAQQARRILDRLVGYKLSPLLWQKLSRRWLSAGRVQSVVVRLIVEREREIRKFTKVEFYTIESDFVQSDDKSEPIHAQLYAKDGVKYEEKLSFNLFDGVYTTGKTTILTKDQSDQIILDLKAPFGVSAVDKKEIKRTPPPPFTTSTLQQEAGRKLYFSAKKTMQVAQKLYEEGFISYHRTDSVNLSEKFISEAREFIINKYGQELVPEVPRKFQTKSKVAQEAHEAIRPTNLAVVAEELERDDLNHDHVRLYEIIWKRALASQAKEAVFDSTTVIIKSINGYEFQTQGSVVKFEGFLKITGRENGEVVIPSVTVGENLEIKNPIGLPHLTNPPPRYTEAALVKTLEEKDIGRPSTYAPIISTVIERTYVIKEEKKLVPTELGETVTDFLVEYFPDILSLPFTAKMEANLDDIANGQRDWVPVVSDFFNPFISKIDNIYKNVAKVKMVEEILEEKCPKCGSPLVIRIGKFGKFVACTSYPKCDYTRQLVEKIDMKCPRCGGDIIIKKSRHGKVFYGCSNYPKCNFAAWRKEDIK